MLARDGFRALKNRMDPEVYGGAVLLGLNGNVIKAHGSARERAIMSAIRVAAEEVRHNVNQLISEQIARANERLATTETPASIPA
jgi:glycerol-3-phosphate acyltransferase PlsX